MQVDGVPISDEELGLVTARVAPFATAMADRPTEFELITAIGLVYFARHACDFVVFEAGMGGRLDSTNVVEAPEALVSVITGIAMDHTAYLGDTPEKIAAEKGVHFLNAAASVTADPADSIHMNEAGHAATAELMYEQVRRILG